MLPLKIWIPASLLILSGCTREGLASMHPDGWTDPGDLESHARVIMVRGTDGCRSCHGGWEKDDYFGGSTGVSCYACHGGGQSGHPAWSTWMGDVDSPEFHGTIATYIGEEQCMNCHSSSSVVGSQGHTCNICHL